MGQHVKAYRLFADHFHFSLLPLQTMCICLFMVHLALQGKCQSTIKNYLNSLSTYGQLRDYHALNLNNVFIRLTLLSILQTIKIESRIAKPLTLTMLNQMVHHINFNHPLQVAPWVAVVLGFHLLLRKSNLVPNTALEFSPLHQLVCKDIHFHRDPVLVNIKWSKNCQIGNRVTMPLLRSKSPACPVQL